MSAQPHSPPEGSRGESFCDSSSCWGLRLFLGLRLYQSSISASILTWPSCLCLWVSSLPVPSLTRTPQGHRSLDLGPTLTQNDLLSSQGPNLVTAAKTLFFSNILFIYLLLERGEGREKKRERNRTDCLSLAPNWGPGPHPRHVP